MNVAFLLVTSACLTGADPVPLPAAAPPLAAAADKAPAVKPPEKIPGQPAPGAMVASAPAYGSCSGCSSGCGTGCAQWSECPSLFSRWKAGWSRHGCDTCNTCNTCDTCNTCGHAPKVYAAPCATCDSCAKSSCFDKWKGHGSCDACGSPGLFGRFRSHKDSGCGCDTGCSSCSSCSSCGSAGTSGTVIQTIPGKPGEPLKVMPKEGEPKKLPEGKEAAAPVFPELTPTTSQTIEVGTKRPF